MKKQVSRDFDDGGVDDHGGGGLDEAQENVDIATLREFSYMLQSQPRLYSESWRRSQIQKVPSQMRRRKQHSEPVYDPIMVSLGPYHHGKPELRPAEEFKYVCLDRRAGGDEKKKAFLYSKILDEIDGIRNSYAEVAILEKYDDKSLALMMLLDASIIIEFIHNYIGMKGNSFLSWQRCLGAGSGPLMVRDMLLMENQIPFRVVKLLISLQYEREEAVSFFPRFMSINMGLELIHAAIPQEDEDPPLHFLEAFHRIVVKKDRHTMQESSYGESKFLLSGFSMREEMNNEMDISYIHRSVMDLKAKGIHVRPNSSQSISDISFRRNACFSHLHLPLQYVSDLTPVVCANMIAFEVLPNGISSLVVLSYAIFMKSLIQSPEDVKELQERGVLLNRVVNLEKVVEVFKEIDTFGILDQDVFKDVKREIEVHCNNRARTWIADLVYTRFRTPWTAIALFAAAILLCLTFLQTIYTIRR